MPGSVKRWLPMAALGLGVMLAGIVMPQMLPNAAAVPEPTPKAAPAPQDPWGYEPPTFADGPDARSMLLRLGVGTVVVVGLCIGTLWFGKRWLQVAPPPAVGERQLGVIEALSLNHRCCVYLIKVGPRQMLAGVDGSGLKALVPLTEPFEQTLNDLQAGEPVSPPVP
jgi:flagellar biogenesis protein FliO